MGAAVLGRGPDGGHLREVTVCCRHASVASQPPTSVSVRQVSASATDGRSTSPLALSGCEPRRHMTAALEDAMRRRRQMAGHSRHVRRGVEGLVDRVGGRRPPGPVARAVGTKAHRLDPAVEHPGRGTAIDPLLATHLEPLRQATGWSLLGPCARRRSTGRGRVPTTVGRAPLGVAPRAAQKPPPPRRQPAGQQRALGWPAVTKMPSCARRLRPLPAGQADATLRLTSG